MSNQLPSKERISLAELKRAIEFVPPLVPGVKAYVYQSRRADAWRTAFEWLQGWDIRTGDPSASGVELLKEYTEGMALVEKLR